MRRPTSERLRSAARLRAPLLGAALAFAVASVAAGERVSPAELDATPKRSLNKDELINSGGWKLETATGADGAEIAALFAPGVELVLDFERDGVRASAGCNELRGRYGAGSKKITMNVSIATKMACDDAKNLADQRASELLSATFKADMRETVPMRLRLIGEDGTTLIFVEKPLRF